MTVNRAFGAGQNVSDSNLKQILDMQAAKVISDEQIQRVCAPVIRMIELGVLDQKRKRRKRLELTVLPGVVLML